MQHTPWFPVAINPCSDAAHVGEYEYRINDCGRITEGTMTWDGQEWRDQCGLIFPAWRGDEWRGLTKRAA